MTWKPRLWRGTPKQSPQPGMEVLKQSRRTHTHTHTHTQKERGVSGRFKRLLRTRHHQEFYLYCAFIFLPVLRDTCYKPLLASFWFPSPRVAALGLNPALSPRPALSCCFSSLVCFTDISRLFATCGHVCCPFLWGHCLT